MPRSFDAHGNTNSQNAIEGPGATEMLCCYSEASHYTIFGKPSL